MTDDLDVLRYSAFAATPAGGNPAGVVLDAGGMTDERMQRIAADVGYSETAFLVGRAADAPVPRYRVRYWSPAAEVPFCGHATVATAVALAERDGPGGVVFDTVGRITEDPATGSAAASVGAYLRELGHTKHTIRIHQGAHVRRPSLLTVTIPPSGGIEVSGGAFRLP